MQAAPRSIFQRNYHGKTVRLEVFGGDFTAAGFDAGADDGETEGNFYILKTTGGGATTYVTWGSTSDQPVAAYDVH